MVTEKEKGARTKGDWETVIEEKINEAKSRGAKKRGWVVLRKSWLTSSINYRMALDEIAVYSKLIVMADEYGPIPGLISDNDLRPMPHNYLAHQACCPIEVLESVITKSIEDDSIFENSHGIFLTHFDDYQFTEYDRQKPYRDKKKDEGKAKRKVCPECGYKEKTAETECPKCVEKGKEVYLNTDYTGGRYGHMVQR